MNRLSTSQRLMYGIIGIVMIFIELAKSDFGLSGSISETILSVAFYILGIMFILKGAVPSIFPTIKGGENLQPVLKGARVISRIYTTFLMILLAFFLLGGIMFLYLLKK